MGPHGTRSGLPISSLHADETLLFCSPESLRKESRAATQPAELLINLPAFRTAPPPYRGRGHVQQRRNASVCPRAGDTTEEARVTTKSSRGMGMINTERTLTVSSLHREWGEAHRREHSVALNGNWLSTLGIMPGQKIRVVTNGAVITLTPVSFEGELRHYEK
jgi:hypothetical protein